MKTLLSGNAQFIVTSITFLIASGQSAYVNRLKKILRDKDFKGTKPQWRHIHVTYRWLLCFWWLTVLAATGGGVRILLVLIDFETNWLDGGIIVVMLTGYLFGAYVGGRSWKWTLKMPTHVP